MTQYNSVFLEDFANETAEFETRFRNAMMRINTCLPVIVESVNATGVAPVGVLTCRIALLQIDQKGDAMENAIIQNVPYSRLQGGRNAVIIDPKKGDLGWCIFSQRDISALKNVKAITTPGSKRIFNLGDAIYMGGILNGTPNQYIHFTENGIDIYSPDEINLVAPRINIKGAVNQSGGNVAMAQRLDVVQGASMAGVEFGSHVHPENDNGGPTGGPINPK